jgi:ubiquinone/menaquinone biosynthesis C-methylase UbiE
MLYSARVNLELAGLMDRVLLDRVDAKQMPYEDERFALVISNSLVHHLADPTSALREIVRVTSRDGAIFVRDLVRPESNEEVTRLVERHARDESSTAKQMLADSLRAALTLDEMRQIVARLGFDPRNVQTTSDRHWTWKAYRADAMSSNRST